MAEEEKQIPSQKLIRATFIGDSELPVHYVNIVNVRGGSEEFFITLGTAMPPEIADIKDLESIDTVKVHAIFRFAMSRQVMKDVIELMQRIYDQQTKQIEMMQTLQEKGGEDDDEDTLSSRTL
jgi:hypothetical protein